MLRRPQASSECGPALAFERRGIGRPPRSISKKILNESVKLRRTRRRERQLKNLRQKGNHKLWGGRTPEFHNSIQEFRCAPPPFCAFLWLFFFCSSCDQVLNLFRYTAPVLHQAWNDA